MQPLESCPRQMCLLVVTNTCCAAQEDTAAAVAWHTIAQAESTQITTVAGAHPSDQCMVTLQSQIQATDLVPVLNLGIMTTRFPISHPIETSRRIPLPLPSEYRRRGHTRWRYPAAQGGSAELRTVMRHSPQEREHPRTQQCCIR
jgi:hypothetical protein